MFRILREIVLALLFYRFITLKEVLKLLITNFKSKIRNV